MQIDELKREKTPLGVQVFLLKRLNGELGYQIGSSWTAMGFPCTGGRGAVDWKGSIYAPKNVSFMFSNNCPMAFKERGEIEEQLRREIHECIPAKLKHGYKRPLRARYLMGLIRRSIRAV